MSDNKQQISIIPDSLPAGSNCSEVYRVLSCTLGIFILLIFN